MLKKIIEFLISSKFMAILLIVFAAAMAMATFIEDRFDTVTAQILVYNALWFEIIMFFLALNFLGHIKRYKMLSRTKIAGFLFHTSFVIMIIGAGVTRYFGYEGSMNIREGESSNTMQTSEPYLNIQVSELNKAYNKDYQLNLSNYLNNSFQCSFPKSDKGKVTVELLDYKKYADIKVTENIENGTDILEMVVFEKDERQRIFIKDGEIASLGNSILSFNYNMRPNSVRILGSEGHYKIESPGVMLIGAMQSQDVDTVRQNTPVDLKENFVYRTEGTVFIFSNYYKNAKLQSDFSADAMRGAEVLILNIGIGDKNHEAIVFGGSGDLNYAQEYSFDGIDFKIAYSNKTVELPFSLTCRDFILERYPGSNSPSSFASEVRLVDTEKNIHRNYRIFMNNVLDYRGYRFFQSSYDPDEKGTILSVNHDFYGTWITYFSYFLLTLAFIFTLMGKNSQFRHLMKKNKMIREKRKTQISGSVMFILLLFSLSTSGYSQNTVRTAVEANHAERFGALTVQTFDGRFAPVHTLAVDVLHKISRKDNFNVPGKGKLNYMQVFLDMILDSEYWKKQKMIYVREEPVCQLIGIEGKYAAFEDFFDSDNHYKLQSYAETAFRKLQSEQNKFDKEVIKVDERVNICMMVFTGDFLKIFPPENTADQPWIRLNDSLAYKPLTGSIKIINDNLQLSVLNYNNIARLYFSELIKSDETGDYSRPNQILSYIENIQRQSAYAAVIPSETKTKYEILYNKSNVFSVLRNIYAFLSLFLLIFAFIDNLSNRKRRIVKWALNFFIVLFAFAFMFHTAGMAVRWYLSGHAPWSNGYEALILVSWGSVLAGFSFIRSSKITLAAAALMAFFMLMTAGHSSYDPQLTNLQPVLKSYWLIVHVAILTVSYSFLGAGFFLGIINLVINIFKNQKNKVKFNLVILELTGINEMNLTIGIGMATVGTFLGGIWANESWGRYWGWDAKETWALIIVITYTIILHFRLIPKLRGAYLFNVGSVIAFGSVLMTFIGVNYYLSKGMHSYGAGETPIFPIWAWIAILSIISLILISGIKETKMKTDDISEKTTYTENV